MGAVMTEGWRQMQEISQRPARPDSNLRVRKLEQIRLTSVPLGDCVNGGIIVNN